MVTRTQISLVASGQTFRPSTIAAPFSEAEDPGAIGKLGRYRGVPVPAGSATFSVPESEQEGIRYLHALVYPLMPVLRAGGATDFFIHITYQYDHQCGLGYDPEEIRMLADFGCEVMIDCWRHDDHDTNPA
jgi:hypothetical protein